MSANGNVPKGRYASQMSKRKTKKESAHMQKPIPKEGKRQSAIYFAVVNSSSPYMFSFLKTLVRMSRLESRVEIKTSQTG